MDTLLLTPNKHSGFNADQKWLDKRTLRRTDIVRVGRRFIAPYPLKLCFLVLIVVGETGSGKVSQYLILDHSNDAVSG